MKKLLIVYNKVWPYREVIFEILNTKFDITVAYSDPKFRDKVYPFKTLYLPGRELGPFFIHSVNLHKLAKQFDAVLGLYDIRWLKLMLLSLAPFRKYSVTYWGIGVTASYHNKYDSKKTWDGVRHFFGRQSDSIILYSDYPINKHVAAGVDRKKIFVANNTTEVYYDQRIFRPKEKKNFLFVGTLYPQKGFEVLLESYIQLSKKNRNIPNLDIVGDGPYAKTIIDIVRNEGIEEKVVLHGAVYDPEKLSSFFQTALACVSPKQAGLSVLTSMGNATIFVTEKDAITGGEIFNIKNKVNGIIYDGEKESLLDVMEWILNNREMVIEMSIAARNFYEESRLPEHMAGEISSAIEYAIETRS